MCALPLGLGPRAELLGCRVSIRVALGDMSKQLPKDVSNSRATLWLFQIPLTLSTVHLSPILLHLHFSQDPSRGSLGHIHRPHGCLCCEGLILTGFAHFKRGWGGFPFSFFLIDFPEFVTHSGHEFSPGRTRRRVSSGSWLASGCSWWCHLINRHS